MIPCHAFSTGRTTTRVTLSTGRKTVPKIDRSPFTDPLPLRSRVTSMIEERTSSRMILRRVKVLPAMGNRLLNVESR